jgi:hypothetical protein
VARVIHAIPTSERGQGSHLCPPRLPPRSCASMDTGARAELPSSLGWSLVVAAARDATRPASAAIRYALILRVPPGDGRGSFLTLGRGLSTASEITREGGRDAGLYSRIALGRRIHAGWLRKREHCFSQPRWQEFSQRGICRRTSAGPATGYSPKPRGRASAFSLANSGAFSSVLPVYDRARPCGLFAVPPEPDRLLPRAAWDRRAPPEPVQRGSARASRAVPTRSRSERPRRARKGRQ